MFSISGDTASGFPVLEESSSLFGRVKSFCPSFLAARLTFSCRCIENFQLRNVSQNCPSFLWPDHLIVCCCHAQVDKRCRSLWRDILFARTLHHQIGRLSFCHRRRITRGHVLSSFRHGTNHKVLSGLREKTFHMAARTCRKTHGIKQTQNVIPLISRETSFGSWVPN